MKRLFLACIFLVLGIVGASAACPASLAVMKDNAASTFNMGLITDPVNGGTNCVGVESAAAAQATVTAGNTLNGVTAITTGSSVPVSGYGTALINVNCTVTCAGVTVVFQASDVQGFPASTSTANVGGIPVVGNGTMVGSITPTTTGPNYYCVPNLGYVNMRANATAYTSGTLSVTITPINVNSCDLAQVANALAAVANNADGVSASAALANSPVVGFNMIFNGTTWDRMQGDSGKNTKVVLGGGTPETASTTGTTAATTATLAASSGKTTFICAFSIRANATAAATGNATVTGTITGTLNFTQWTAPNASGVGVTEEIFTPCVPASATNTTIAVVSAAPGTGGVVSVSAWGYQQ